MPVPARVFPFGSGSIPFNLSDCISNDLLGSGDVTIVNANRHWTTPVGSSCIVDDTGSKTS